MQIKIQHERKCVFVLEKKLQSLEEKLEKKYEEKLRQKDQHIQELESKIENFALQAIARPTTTNNTTINAIIQKLDPVTIDCIESSVPQLTIEHIKKGPQGYAEYALTHPFKNRIICVDYARRKIKYKNSEGNTITDPEMTKLATKLFKSIQDRNNSLIQEYMAELFRRVEYSPQVVSDMADYMCMVNSGARGEKSNLCNEFVKSVCSSAI